jgi:hypothetical protein
MDFIYSTKVRYYILTTVDITKHADMLRVLLTSKLYSHNFTSVDYYRKKFECITSSNGMARARY